MEYFKNFFIFCFSFVLHQIRLDYILNFGIFTDLKPILLKEILLKKGYFFFTLYDNGTKVSCIHIWKLYKHVDKFMFVTSIITFSGLSKNISFKEFEKNINPYMDKINIVYFNNAYNKR